MKVSRFGPKKRPDPSPEDEWLRQALLDAQDADLKTTLQDAPPPYPHTAAYLRREKRQAPGISAPVAALYPAGRLFGPGRRPGGRRGRGAGSGPAGAGGHPQPGRDLFPERDGEHRVHLFALLPSDGKREVPALQFHEHCPGKGQCDRRERGMVSPHFPSDQDLSRAWGNRSGKLCIE